MTETENTSFAETLYRESRTWIWRFGMAIQVVLLVSIAFFIRPSADPFILRYNAFFGVDLLGTWWQAYLVPSISLVFFLGNLVLAALLARRSAYLAAVILAYGALLIVLSEAIGMAAIVSINS
jgi:hypothetical protein